MGINAQDIIAQDPDMLRKQLYQREMQQLNPSGDVFGTIGALLGRGAANVSQGRGFFDVADPALRRVAKMNEYQQEAMQIGGGDPVRTLEALSARLIEDPDLAPLAMKVQEQLLKLRPAKEKPITVAPGGSLVTPTGELIYQAPDREKDVSPGTEAERDYLVSLQAKYPDTPVGRAKAANEFASWKSSFRQKEAAAGVPGAGEVKVTDVAAAAGIVDRFVNEPKDRLATANAARTQLNLAKKGSGPAFAQLQRQLVKLVGDNQISGAEVRSALGRAGIVGDTIDAVNVFMTGTPSKDKLNAVEQVINALEQDATVSYNQGRDRAKTVVEQARLAPETVNALIPPKRLFGADKQAYDWAKANPKDPRSTAILNRLGVK